MRLDTARDTAISVIKETLITTIKIELAEKMGLSGGGNTRDDTNGDTKLSIKVKALAGTLTITKL